MSPSDREFSLQAFEMLRNVNYGFTDICLGRNHPQWLGTARSTKISSKYIPANQNITIDFLGRVKIARCKVLEEYPTATLYVVTASTKSPDGVNSTYGLTYMEVIFRLDGGVAPVTSVGDDNFGPIEVRPESIVGSANLDWPVGMDATDANRILKEQGHTGNYYALTLRKPLYPGADEDYYLFSIVNGHEVSIETKGHKR
ncbi:hypothetical protein PSPO01_16566 [Paraphaeosphaeria sporulosa]